MATYEVTVSGTNFNVSIAQLANAEITAKVTEAQTAASNAATSETNAAASATSAANTYDSFDDRYLGAKASAPAVDNDGDALLVGALYFDTGLNEMRGWTGSAWVSTATTFDSANANITGGTINVTEVTAAQYNSTEALPDIKPSLNLDFANTKALDPRITYTRGSTATYYDGKTFAKAEENLLLYSQEFDNAAWLKSNSTASANSQTAPDGTTTADTLVENTSAGEHSVAGNEASITSGVTYTISVFAKQGSGSRKLAFRGFGEGANYPIFNLTTGAVDNNGTNWSNQTITDVGNSWYRCSATVTASATAKPLFHLIDGSTLSYTGDGTSSIILWGAQLEQRSALTDYTATTTQPITNYVPALQTAASGEPRFDHDPITGESKGFLIEEQRTNLLTYSEQFDNAAWAKPRVTVRVNTVVAPDGTLTGNKLVEDTNTGEHFTDRNLAVTSGTTYTFSVFAKAAEETHLRLRLAGGFTDTSTFFNLETGVITSSQHLSASIQDVGNGWYRCTITATATSSASAVFRIQFPDGVYTGDGYSGIYLWGASLEQASFPTSYIKTEASQVTRSPDAASMTGTNFSSWYRQDEGTVFVEASTNQTSFTTTDDRAHLVTLGSPDGQNYVTTYFHEDELTILFRNAGAGSESNALAGVVGGGAFNKTAFVFSGASDAQFAIDSLVSSAFTNRAFQKPAIDRLLIGTSQVPSGRILDGHIKKLAFYPKRLSNATLQALTED